MLENMTTRDLAAALLIRRLYVDLGQAAGGPLHVVLDDGNVDDQYIRSTPDVVEKRYEYLWNGDFEQWADVGDDVSVELRQDIQRTCEAILVALRGMTKEHRSDLINWTWNWVDAHMRWQAKSPPWWWGSDGPVDPPPELTTEQLESAKSEMDILIAAGEEACRPVVFLEIPQDDYNSLINLLCLAINHLNYEAQKKGDLKVKQALEVEANEAEALLSRIGEQVVGT